ncbi:hypothetical protein BsWGS_27375 [Bradybaena similaris]
MLTRLAPLLRAAPRIQQSRRMGHAVPAHWKSMRQVCEETKAHMNFLPVPQGSWQEAYSKQNAKYNQLLALSVVSVIVTAFAMWQSGSVYLHTAPPMRNKKKE